MAPDCYLVRQEHVPHRAAFPVVDAHNHLWGDWTNLDTQIAIMDQVGVVCYADLTANVSIEWAEGGYRLGQGDWGAFLSECAGRYPGRFYGFTAATFARPADRPLFADADRFVAETIDLLRQHVEQGACGLKILKELGLHYCDGNGELVSVDDPRLDPIWVEAGRLGVPVLMHQSDPYGFFQPVTPDNEHYESLLKYPDWSFADERFPRKETLLAARDRVIQRHPDTTFMLPHVANYAENLGYVSQLLDENPNVYIDFSARLDELGRQPYSAREFMIRYQDRIYFGTDMPASLEMYRCHFRFLETFDECFDPPDYDGTFGRRRWAIHGIGLPPEVLTKVYHQNALRIVPGLRELTGLDVQSG
jgi:predicted TIM-barrel fold metal-dependent hydrolase